MTMFLVLWGVFLLGWLVGAAWGGLRREEAGR